MYKKIVFLLIFIVIVGFIGKKTYEGYYLNQSKTGEIKVVEATVKSSSLKDDKVLDIQEIDLKNGNILWHVPFHDNDVVTFSISFKGAGKKADYDGMNGLSMLLSNTIDEGCGDLSANEVKNFLIDKNIQLSISSGNDNITINVRTLKKNINDCIKFLKTMLKNPTFEEKAMKRVKDSMLQDFNQSKVNEGYISRDNIMKRTLGNHPYYTSVDSMIKSLSIIDKKTLNDFLKKHLCRDNSVIASAGNLTNEEAKEIFLDLLSAIPEKSDIKKVDDASLSFDGKTEHVHVDVPQCVIMFTHPAVSRHHKDFYNIFMINFMLAGNTFNSRMWNEIREKRGLAYSLGTSISINDNAHYISGYMGTHFKNTKDAIDILKREWEKASENGFTEEELESSKKQLIGTFAINFDSTKKIVRQMISYKLDGLNANYVNERNSIINSISLSDINKVAKTFLERSKLSFGVAGKKS